MGPALEAKCEASGLGLALRASGHRGSSHPDLAAEFDFNSSLPDMQELRDLFGVNPYTYNNAQKVAIAVKAIRVRNKTALWWLIHSPRQSPSDKGGLRRSRHTHN